ncbi:DNA repair protein rad52, variant 2 [Purpureocillium takamizusanense]|uniref:DNA repair protein rad52, variant 2 n=1 Tax=Purpureocillium takamizusanense TaxID=2060973 RepID=A0A9Q8QIQ8_9HYPO|nr:DNA repair protein rad52, variant 2 [Purpureocillium takamizusanense]UNI20558.1 DNA repair protein rad52, variant 2 [Purpureocillium takamizusanense]
MYVELDEADFCVPGDGHPDEVMVPHPTVVPPADRPPQMQPPTRQFNRAASAGTGTTRPLPPHTPNPANSRPAHHQDNHQGRPVAGNGRGSPNPSAQQPSIPNPAEPVAFFSARSVSTTNAAEPNAHIQNKQLFNPKAESPSIRKTPGIDHNSSRPLARNGQHIAPASSQSSAPSAPGATAGNTSSFTPVRQSAAAATAAAGGGPVTRSNVVNPSLDYTRRIGAPGGPGSPLANRNSYKPPSMKRPLPAGDGNGAVGVPRSPLVDVPPNTSGQANAPAADGADAKRPRMT